uniref:AraC family transcriptional regulator n=1 Tax=Roseihalotalea indica TaxID=2867963 RepID=A0AA49JDA1_9BACT|nr:AraC family transcriptional regulator [Tunicatimonas sp. TK19036]
MKPHFHKVPVQPQSSYSIRHDVQSNFPTLWHYHPEIELHYTIRGEGVRFIGDTISNFSAGEMLLLGENLPHTWRCREEYFQENSGLEVEAVVLHFLPNCLGRDILSLPEAYLIPKLFESAKRGLIIKGEAKDKIADMMHAALNATNLDRLITLLTMLKILAEAEEVEPIASAHAFYPNNEAETKRLDEIYSYTFTHYKKEIGLEEIASIANLSVTSFCRYFKQMTKKTYYDFLTEVRISHVCRALIENKLATEVICFENGFNNVSNFYRHFKKVTKMTPLEYKKKYLKTI